MTKRPDDERDLGRPNKTAHNDKPAPRSTATNYVEWTPATFVSTDGTSAYQPVSTDELGESGVLSTVTKSDEDTTTIMKEDTQTARDKSTESVTEGETNTVTAGDTKTVTTGDTNAFTEGDTKTVTENFKEYTVMMSSSDEMEYMSRVLVVFCFQVGLELVIAACD